MYSRKNNKVTLTNNTYSKSKNQTGALYIPEDLIYSDCSVFIKDYRSDNSNKTTSKLIKVYTPIMLKLKKYQCLKKENRLK